MRILKDRVEFKDLVSRVFTFDYIGALLASLIFLFAGTASRIDQDIAVFWHAQCCCWMVFSTLFQKRNQAVRWIALAAAIILIVQLLAFVFSDSIMNYSETLYL